ncbi:hypothetical protein M9H77_14808 [Catharanthus roseus]|uniref:Uncharacterized protein n=1 Tax=Catharanthus roseus TaxID=4058 RepID=A0ACC0BP98_CATRO|nr:hypothetical protein M9H77_14808 [Catharanthus roseus]
MPSSSSYDPISNNSSTVPMSSSAKGWVDRISNIFRQEMAIDHIDHLPPVCVFQVPKALSLQKPESYSPQLIALGPYHHLRPELYHMERHKLKAIKQISTSDQIFNFQNLVISRLKEFDPCTRACYNKFMDYDQDTLAWIIAIDGCFLVNLVNSYSGSDFDSNGIITRDIMMVENQIPFVLLQEIRNCLNLCPNNELLRMFLNFCEINSPIKLNIDKENYHRMPRHLLDLMYHLIVEFPGRVQSPKEDGPPREVPVYIDMDNRTTSSWDSSINDSELFQENVGAILEMVGSMGDKRTQAVLKPVKIVSDIPWSSISGLFRKGTLHHGEENNLNDEIAIPSISYLWRYAEVKCRPAPAGGGIHEIKFMETEPALYLPILNLNSSSETILRNLVAYEAATSRSSLELARFVNLMNGIIDTAEDVKLLKQNGVIIATNLTDDEIADLFNGMKRFYVRSNKKSNIEIAIQKVNEYYDKKLVVRFIRRAKKNLYTSWKCMAVISTVLLFVVLGIESFCSIYSCSRFWGGRLN